MKTAKQLRTASIMLALTACAPATAPSGPISLAGSEWGYADGTDRFVQFGNAMRVSGSGGCNSFSGTYAQEGDKLQIGSLAVTRMACPEPIMSNESEFLANLERTRTASIAALTLTLMDADGAVLTTLQRRDPD